MQMSVVIVQENKSDYLHDVRPTSYWVWKFFFGGGGGVPKKISVPIKSWMDVEPNRNAGARRCLLGQVLLLVFFIVILSMAVALPKLGETKKLNGRLATVHFCQTCLRPRLLHASPHWESVNGLEYQVQRCGVCLYQQRYGDCGSDCAYCLSKAPSLCHECGNKGPAQCECESVRSPTSPVTPPDDRGRISAFHSDCTVEGCDLYGADTKYGCPVVAHRTCTEKLCFLTWKDKNDDCPKGPKWQGKRPTSQPVPDKKEVAAKDAGPTDTVKEQESVVQKDDEAQRGEKDGGAKVDDDDDDKTIAYTLPLIKNQMDKNEIKDPEPPKKKGNKRKRRPKRNAAKKLKRTESKLLSPVDAFKYQPTSFYNLRGLDKAKEIRVWFCNGYRTDINDLQWEKIKERAYRSLDEGKKQAAVICLADPQTKLESYIYTDDITFFLYYSEKDKI